ncbi:hypothetical protein FOXYSP1_19094 [Fusarium oxysporum f. sp. phaseoli]
MGGGITRDDLATYTSYALMIGYCITACVARTYGGGLNQLESGYAATIFYAPMALIETMIGIYIFIGMLVAYYVSGLFIKIFICWPISAYWKGETDKCLNQSAIIFADTIISAISDLVILLLPTPLTWSLQLSRRKRLRVIGILCAGGVATAFSIYRLAMILHEGKSVN